MTAYLYRQKLFGRSVILRTFITLILIVFFARLSKYQIITSRPEIEKTIQLQLFVYILDPDINCRKMRRFNYEFQIPNCSAYPPHTLLRLNGSFTSTAANSWKVDNKLIFSDISVIGNEYYSVEHFEALIFGFMPVLQGRLQQWTRQFLLKSTNIDISELLTSMLWGTLHDPKSKVIKDKMRAAGLSHVLAVSGFHLNYLIALFELLNGSFSSIVSYPQKLLFVYFKNLRSRPSLFGVEQLKIVFLLGKLLRITSLVFLLFLLLFYSLVVGAQASVMRAYLTLFWKRIDRTFLKQRLNLYLVQIWVLVIMLLYNPFYLFQLSWQLSVMAVIGLVSTKHLFSASLFRLTKIGRSLASVIAVNIFVCPLLVIYFNEINFSTLISSIFLVPVIEFCFTAFLWLLLMYGLYLVLPWFFRPFFQLFSLSFSRLAGALDFLLSLFHWSALRLDSALTSHLFLMMLVYYTLLLFIMFRRLNVKAEN